MKNLFFGHFYVPSEMYLLLFLALLALGLLLLRTIVLSAVGLVDLGGAGLDLLLFLVLGLLGLFGGLQLGGDSTIKKCWSGFSFKPWLLIRF